MPVSCHFQGCKVLLRTGKRRYIKYHAFAFFSYSRSGAVSLQVSEAINPAVGSRCHYFRRFRGNLSSYGASLSLSHLEPLDHKSSTLTTTPLSTPCELQGWKNRPTPFPGRMSYKATNPGSVCPVSLSRFFERVCYAVNYGHFLRCVVLCYFCVLSLGCSC